MDLRRNTMPLYQYKCCKTQTDVTKMVKMNDKNKQTCDCGAKLKSQLTTTFISNANSGGRSG